MRINNRSSATVVIALLAAGLLADCGGGAPARSPGNVMSNALHYADCMRSHGLSNFPDPNGQGVFNIQGVQVHNGVTTRDLMPSSPAFQAAERVCGPFASAGRGVPQAEEKQYFHKELKAAACMRANGVPHYPDPKYIDGSIDLEFSPSLNINPNSPAFLRAEKKCAHGKVIVGTG